MLGVFGGQEMWSGRETIMIYVIAGFFFVFILLVLLLMYQFDAGLFSKKKKAKFKKANVKFKTNIENNAIVICLLLLIAIGLIYKYIENNISSSNRKDPLIVTAAFFDNLDGFILSNNRNYIDPELSINDRIVILSIATNIAKQACVNCSDGKRRCAKKINKLAVKKSGIKIITLDNKYAKVQVVVQFSVQPIRYSSGGKNIVQRFQYSSDVYAWYDETILVDFIKYRTGWYINEIRI